MAYTKGNLYFNYNGKSSKEFGITIISTSNGMYEDILMAERSITMNKPKDRTKSMLQSVEETDISFPLEVGFDNGFTDKKIEDIVLWLKTPYFRPFFFEENPNRVFNVMFTDSASLIHNGLKDGYFTITAQTNSPRIYSPVKLTDKKVVTTSSNILLENQGHEIVYPEISINVTAGNKVKIETLNKSTNAVENIFEINNLTAGEDLYLDCYREVIETDITGVFHYEDTVGNFPSLKIGESILKVTGQCSIQLRYQEEYIF